jgi:hypothetical protein
MSSSESFKNMVQGVDCEIPNVSIAMAKTGNFVIALHVKDTKKKSESLFILTPENAVEVMETLSIVTEKLANLSPPRKTKKGDNPSWN